MKILSYNINRSTQEKIDKIMQFNADVFIKLKSHNGITPVISISFLSSLMIS